MASQHIAARRGHWTDTAFRRVRRLGGLELYLNVLIAAQLIGTVYYRALERATECPRLKWLCRAVLADELAHVGLESELILTLRSRRNAPVRTLARLAHRALFLIAADVVWITHRGVLRHAGHDARSFRRACREQYAFHLEPLPTRAPPAVLAVIPRQRG